MRGHFQLACARYPIIRSLLSGVPNLEAIDPAVPEIWKRHPARAHVQTGSKVTFCTAPYLPVPNRLPNLSAMGPAVLEIWKCPLHVRTCSSTLIVTHKNALSGGCLLPCLPTCQVSVQSAQPLRSNSKWNFLDTPRAARATCCCYRPNVTVLVLPIY